MRARGRGRGVVALGTVLTGMLLAWSPRTFALNPALNVSQYAHMAWKIRDGFVRGVVNTIAQTPDGYLWLGTEFGIVRFDGVRPLPWQPPNQPLPSNNVRNLLAARDGALWIATSKGLASWNAGKITQYPELAGQYVRRLLEDHEGRIWASAGSLAQARVCAIEKGRVQCYGEDGSFGQLALSLYEDSKGSLWVGAMTGLWRWRPDPHKLYSMPVPSEIRALIEDDGGALWIAMAGGIRRFVGGKAEAYRLAATGQLNPTAFLRDREGGLWIGTLGRGVVHLHRGRTDVFTQADGLSGDLIGSIFEDREGSIWIATGNGLDRFRALAVPTYSVHQGLSNDTVVSVLGAGDGSVWVATFDGLNRWHNGTFTIYRKRPGRQMAGVHETVVSGLPDQELQSLFQDRRGRIWVSTRGGVGYLEDDRYISVRDVPGGIVKSMAEDAAGNLWIANLNLGLFRLSRGSEVAQIPWVTLGHQGAARTLAADPLDGGLWLGFLRGGVAYWKDGRPLASYGAADGLGEGRVNDLRFDHEGTLWAATEGGLSRLKSGRVATLSGKNGLPCDTVHWLLEDNDHSFWLYTACGLVRIKRPELEAWAADSTRTVRTDVLGSSDGVSISANSGGYAPLAAKSTDGTLWFGSLDGVRVVDSRRMTINALPPPVHIEQITADRKPYDATPSQRLPALIRDLEIDYTALSLAAPEKVKFRYKLEGRDPDWQDAGTRRQAFYNDLPPRHYRFRVIACNNSGVWNEAGAFLDFSVAPAYYQTRLFQASCVAAFLVLLWGLYRLRLRQLAWQFNLRMEERVNERTRIARDFHDTLLQSFQGVLMKFSALAYTLPERPDVQEKLEAVIQQARQAIIEGRDAVQGLRASTVVTNDLVRAIATIGEELAADQTGQHCPEFRVDVEGTTKDLVPLVRDEVHRITCEAVRNAFLHAEAGRIEVEIHYAARQLRVLVRDNGKGIDQKILNEGGRTGHHGLPGMHERAKLAGGKLAVRSKLDSGTEVELTIPASLAYAKSPDESRSMSSGKGI